MTITKPTTNAIKMQNEKLAVLNKNLPKILNQSFWQKKVTIQEKIVYLNAIAEERSLLWELVKKEYPETINCLIEVDNDNVSWETAD